YAGDNNDWLAPNNDGPNCGWVYGWLDFKGNNADNYTTEFLLDPEFAKLGPYTKTAKVYRCPADRSHVDYGGQTYDRVRSVSMSQAVGTQIDPPVRAVTGPWLDGDHDNGPNDRWYTYGKMADIVQPP